MAAGLLAATLGVAQGMRHALEPDHLAAVSTLAGERPGARGGFWVGATWGLGHTASLVIVGGALALFQSQLPERLAAGFELAVAVMLVALGARAVMSALRERRGLHHGNEGEWHSHAGAPPHRHAPVRWRLPGRPLAVGMVHGLAGSGALSALVIAELPGSGARIAFIGLFGLGSVFGMAALTAAMGSSLGRLRRAPIWAARLLLIMGCISILLGIGWGVLSGRALLT